MHALNLMFQGNLNWIQETKMTIADFTVKKRMYSEMNDPAASGRGYPTMIFL